MYSEYYLYTAKAESPLCRVLLSKYEIFFFNLMIWCDHLTGNVTGTLVISLSKVFSLYLIVLC